MKKIVYSLGTALLAFSFLLVSCGKKSQGMAGSHGPAAYPMQVVQETEKTLINAFPASVEGKQDINILPQVSGQIVKVCVEEGAKVKKGQPLFVIDQVPYQAALRTAKANVASAKAQVATAELTFNNNKALFDKGVVSKTTLMTAENSYLTAKATLAQAEASLVNADNNLSYTVVKSPANGVISTINYRVGALVSSAIQKPLTVVSDNSEMYVYFAMAEPQVLKMVRQFGSLDSALVNMPSVDLELCDGSIYQHKGKIESISGIVDATSGQVQLRAVFTNPERLLTSGGSAQIMMPEVYHNAIVVPQSSVFRLQDKAFVYAYADGKAQSKMVTLSPYDDGKTYVVLSGLKAGDKIVSSGVALIRPGTQIVEAKSGAQQQGPQGMGH